MSDRRWMRFLPNRSKLALVAFLMLLVWASIAFLDLAAARNQAVARHDRLVFMIEVAQRQNEMLRRALDAARAKQNVVPKAYQYFGRSPEDQILIVPKIIPQAGSQVSQSELPNDPWKDIADRLDRTLTNLLNRVR